MRSFYSIVGAWCLALMSAVSCREASDCLPSVIVSGGTDGATRTVLVPGEEFTSIHWSAGDRIGIFCSDDSNLCYAADMGGSATTFSAVDSQLKVAEGTVRAYYPYAAENASESSVAVEVPYMQMADAGGETVVPMYSYNDARIVSGRVELRFRSFFPVLALGLKGSGRIAMIVVEPADEEEYCPLAGSYEADLAAGTRTALNLNRRITVKLREAGSDFITLAGDEKWVDIPVVPFSVTGGLKLTMVHADGRRFVKRIWSGGGGVSDGERVRQPIKALSDSDFRQPETTVVTKYDFNSTAYKVTSEAAGESLYRTGPENARWVFYHASPNGTAAARTLKLSYFLSCKHVGYVYTDFVFDNITEIEFKGQTNTGNCKGVAVQISTDGGRSWSEGEVYALSTSSRTCKYYPSTDGSTAPAGDDRGVDGVMIRFTVAMSSLVRSNAEVTLDDIAVTGRTVSE